MRLLAAGLCVAVLAQPLTLWAQDVPPAAPAPAPAPADPTLQAEYDRAFELLASGQYAAAADGFDRVAQSSRDPGQATAARELARLARRWAVSAPSLPVPLPPPAPAPAPKATGLDQGGRTEVVVTSTLGAFYAGFVLDDLFGVEDFRAQTLLIAGTTGAGFAASLLATRGKRITDGMGEAYSLGLWGGLANGLLAGPALGIDVEGDEDDGSVNELYLGFGLATMAVGGAAGMVLADRHDISRAQARFASLMGLNGLATVGLGLAVVQPDFDDPDVIVPALMALGLDTGVAVGASVIPHLDWSSSRISLVGLSEFLGALGGFTAAAVVLGGGGVDDGERIATGLILGGMWAGFGLGAYFTRDMEPDSAASAKAAQPTITIAPTGRGVSILGSF